jgi:hypothetical protein
MVFDVWKGGVGSGGEVFRREKKFSRIELRGDCFLRRKLAVGSVRSRNSLITSSELTLQTRIFPDGSKSFHGRRRDAIASFRPDPDLRSSPVKHEHSPNSFTLTQRPEAKETIVQPCSRSYLLFCHCTSSTISKRQNRVLPTSASNYLIRPRASAHTACHMFTPYFYFTRDLCHLCRYFRLHWHGEHKTA